MIMNGEENESIRKEKRRKEKKNRQKSSNREERQRILVKNMKKKFLSKSNLKQFINNFLLVRRNKTKTKNEKF